MTLETRHSEPPPLPDITVRPVSPDDATEIIEPVEVAAPVFVDSSGRRRRRIRIAFYALGGASLTYAVLVATSLAGGPLRPEQLVPFPELVNLPVAGKSPTPAGDPAKPAPTGPGRGAVPGPDATDPRGPAAVVGVPVPGATAGPTPEATTAPTTPAPATTPPTTAPPTTQPPTTPPTTAPPTTPPPVEGTPAVTPVATVPAAPAPDPVPANPAPEPVAGGTTGGGDTGGGTTGGGATGGSGTTAGATGGAS